MNEYDWVVPSNNLPIYCGPADEDEDAELSVPGASRLVDCGAARPGESRLQFLAARRRRIPPLHARRQPRRIERAQRHRGQLRPASSAGRDRAALSRRRRSGAPNEVANPVFGDHVGQGSANFAQSIRAYDGYSRTPLGSGTLLADFYATDNNIDFQGGAISPYDVSHLDTRYNEGLSWGRTFDGERVRLRRLRASGVALRAGHLADAVAEHQLVFFPRRAAARQ